MLLLLTRSEGFFWLADIPPGLLAELNQAGQTQENKAPTPPPRIDRPVYVIVTWSRPTWERCHQRTMSWLGFLFNRCSWLPVVSPVAF